TFSERIDRASAKNGVELFDSHGDPVSGQVRLSDGNRTVTFVPDAPLAMGASYVLRLDGLTDGSGNALAATTLNITTFSPRTAATFTASDAMSVLRYLTLVKKTTAGGTKTIGFGVAGDVGAKAPHAVG